MTTIEGKLVCIDPTNRVHRKISGLMTTLRRRENAIVRNKLDALIKESEIETHDSFIEVDPPKFYTIFQGGK